MDIPTSLCKQYLLTPPSQPTSVDAMNIPTSITVILSKQCPLTPPIKTTCDAIEMLSPDALALIFGLLFIAGVLGLCPVVQAIKNATYLEATVASCTTLSTYVVVRVVKNATSAFNHQVTLQTAKAIVASAATFEQALKETSAFNHQVTLQTTKAIVVSAATLEQALKESGRVYNPNLVKQFAVASHAASRKIYAREQAEKRGYMFDKGPASRP
jgi:membrane protein implicated in regulation of membrane protease activity